MYCAQSQVAEDFQSQLGAHRWSRRKRHDSQQQYGPGGGCSSGGGTKIIIGGARESKERSSRSDGVPFKSGKCHWQEFDWPEVVFRNSSKSGYSKLGEREHMLKYTVYPTHCDPGHHGTNATQT